MSLDSKLQAYARLLVRTGCALRPGQEVLLTAPVEAAGFARMVVEEAWEAGASSVTVEWTDDVISRLHYLHAPQSAFEKVPEWKALQRNSIAQKGGVILSLDGDDPDGMAGVDPGRFTAWSRAVHRDCKAFYDGMDLGRNVWCIAGAATPKWAKKVFPGLPQEEAMETGLTRRRPGRSTPRPSSGGSSFSTPGSSTRSATPPPTAPTSPWD